MPINSRNSRRRDRRNTRSSKSTLRESSERSKISCRICQELIEDILSAVAHPSSGTAIHFDCAIKAVEEELKPRKGERIIYHGGGGFAVIYSQSSQPRQLKFIRSTEWDKRDEVIEWRKKLRICV